jgi:hypothetical protein
MRWDASLPADVVEALWRQPEALLDGGQRLQHKPSCTVVRVDAGAGPLVLKRHVGGGLRRWRRAIFAPSAAAKAWTDGWFLHAAGIPTPRPRAVLDRRLGPLKTTSYFLADFVPGRSLYRLLRFERPPEAVVRDLARQTAAIWQRLDDLALCHNDFKTENLLVDPQGKVWLIDVDRMLRFQHRDAMRQRQARDAADLLHPRNWRSDPAAAEIFRQEILSTPAGREAAAHQAAHPLNQPIAAVNSPAHLVTALVPCRNASATIRACLDSLRDVADEILVADAGSTDGTLRLVREFGGCRIIHGRADHDAAFLSWAVRQARHEWVLVVRPTEKLNPELGRQVQDVAAADPAHDGFRIWQAIYHRGRRLEHGGFQRRSSVRLFRRGAVQFEMRGGRAEAVLPERCVGQLASRLIAEAWPDDAEQPAGSNQEAAFAKWAWRFFHTYVLRLGLFDGRAGWDAASRSAKTIPPDAAPVNRIAFPAIAKGTARLPHGRATGGSGISQRRRAA